MKTKSVCKKCKKKSEGVPLMHCPKCNQHGFTSIYGDQCTRCSNTERIPEFQARELRVIKASKRKWWEFWK